MKISLMFDLAVLFFLLFSFFMGYRRGAVKELFSALSMLIAILISTHTYIRIGTVIHDKFGLSMVASQLISFVGIFFLIALVCRIAAHFVQKRIEKSDFFSSFNKSFGGGLGLIKAFAIAICLGIVFLFIPPQYMNSLPPSVSAIRNNSFFLKLASLFAAPVKNMAENNKHMKVYEKMVTNPEKFSEKLASSKKFQNFVNSDKVKKFMNNKSVARILKDPKIKKMSEERDYVGLMKELLGGKGQAIINDPEFMKDNTITDIVSEFEDIVVNMTDETKLKNKLNKQLKSKNRK